MRACVRRAASAFRTRNWVQKGDNRQRRHRDVSGSPSLQARAVSNGGAIRGDRPVASEHATMRTLDGRLLGAPFTGMHELALRCQTGGGTQGWVMGDGGSVGWLVVSGLAGGWVDACVQR